MESTKEMLQELVSIKKLLILISIKSGAKSEEIGRAVGIDSSTVRKMFPMRKTKEGD